MAAAIGERDGMSVGGSRPESTQQQIQRLQVAQERVLSALGVHEVGDLAHADSEGDAKGVERDALYPLSDASSRASWRESVLEAQRKRDALLSALIAKHRRSQPWR